MDLPAISTLVRPRTRADLPGPAPGDAWLGGGTWLFSEPQPGLVRLVDLHALGWPPYSSGPDGLTLAATCTLARLGRIEAPAAWRAAPLFGVCCRALAGSFKVSNLATVGGNICLALPAAPVVALAVALDGEALVWSPAGGERRLAVLDLVRGPQDVALAPGEVLRSVHLPAAALARRTAHRRIGLTPNGRSGAFLIGTLDGGDGALALTVTAATRRPVRIALPPGCTARQLDGAVADAIPTALWFDDPHGRPDWRRHVTRALAEEIRAELGAGTGP